MTPFPVHDEARAQRLAARRRALSEAVGGEPVLLMGHRSQSRNFLANERPFRQDSTFLYFLGVSLPAAAALIEAGGATTLYLAAQDPGDVLWTGTPPPPEAWRCASGAEQCRAYAELQPGPYLSLPLCEPASNAEASRLSGQPLDPAQPGATGSASLRAAVIGLRMCRDDAEIAEHRAAVAVTAMAHRAAMAATAPGVHDTAVQALIEAIFALHGMEPAYGSIVTARGEVLHGHAEGRALGRGDLLLVDAGAESAAGYAADITRTWPVDGHFTGPQAAVYAGVLAANRASIAALAAGVPYADIHVASARVLCRVLVDLGLLSGDVDGLVEQGAHAVFFPHGVGHLLGLDVHDMELLGDEVGYAAGSERSSQFGLSFLRLQRTLAAGMVVTIEPGIYFVPAILADETLHARFGDSVRWSAAESWLGFGGVRIEDDVLVTDTGSEVLSAAIPTEIEAIEELVGSGPSPSERLLAERP